jgi:hypothetical protein
VPLLLRRHSIHLSDLLRCSTVQCSAVQCVKGDIAPSLWSAGTLEAALGRSSRGPYAGLSDSMRTGLGVCVSACGGDANRLALALGVVAGMVEGKGSGSCGSVAVDVIGSVHAVVSAGLVPAVESDAFPALVVGQLLEALAVCVLFLPHCTELSYSTVIRFTVFQCTALTCAVSGGVCYLRVRTGCNMTSL